MLKNIVLIIISLCAISQAAYWPQMMLTATSSLINKEISINLGKNISQAINSYKVDDIHAQQKASGVNIKFNLTNIKQHIDIHWKGNILTVKDQHTFVINSKNLNLTLDGQLQVKIGLTRRQKGPLKVIAQGLQIDTTIRFKGSKCEHGLGFDLAIDDVYVNVKSLSIKIQGKSFDNLIITELQKIIIPRVPGLISNALKNKINPLITSYTCKRIEEKLPVGTQNYILVLNTTMVPQFDEELKFLRIPIDLTFQNLQSNETNTELQLDDLPQSHAFQKQSDASLSLSSNFLNTVLWLVEDSHLLNLVVTNEMLGDNPPIALNTTNLSILMPDLKQKWPNKEVFLMITPAGKYEHLLIRSGRLVTVLSLSVKFAVNITGKPLSPEDCLKSGDCQIACDLNMTLPLSLALRVNSKTVNGLIHQAGFYQISKITSQIDINFSTLKLIINEIIGSMIPDLNSQLSDGIELPQKIWQALAKYDISDLRSKTFLDFTSVGMKFDL